MTLTERVPLENRTEPSQGKYDYHIEGAIHQSLGDLVYSDALLLRQPSEALPPEEVRALYPLLQRTQMSPHIWEQQVRFLKTMGEPVDRERAAILAALAKEQPEINAHTALNLLRVWGRRRRNGAPIEIAALQPEELDGRSEWYLPPTLRERLQEAKHQIAALISSDAQGNDWFQYVPDSPPSPQREQPVTEKKLRYEGEMFDKAFTLLHTAALSGITHNQEASMLPGVYGLKGAIQLNVPLLDSANTNSLVKIIPRSRFVQGKLRYSIPFSIHPDDLPTVARKAIAASRDVQDTMRHIGHKHYRRTVRWDRVNPADVKRCEIELVFFTQEQQNRFMVYLSGFGIPDQTHAQVLLHFDNQVEYYHQ